MTKLALTVAILATTCLAFSSAGLADGDVGTMTPEKLEGSFPQKPPYSPYAGRDFPLRPLFGDTHLHTSYSMDAGAFGVSVTGGAGGIGAVWAGNVWPGLEV